MPGGEVDSGLVVAPSSPSPPFFHSKFSILAGVTPIIYSLGSVQASMGERFLKLRIGKNLEHDFESEIISKAISNTGHDTEMRNEMCDACTSFLKQDWESKRMPIIPPQYLEGINYLARFGSALRGVVPRDRFKDQLYLAAPSTEVGSRFAKQLAKLGVSLGLVRGDEKIGAVIYTLLKRITLDSVDQRVEDIVRTVFISCPDANDTISARHLAAETRYPIATITRLLNDLNSLRLI